MRKKEGIKMTEAKFKRVIVALTVGAVILLVTLLSIMIYQLIEIASEKKKEAEYNQSIERLIYLNQIADKTMEQRQEYEWIVQRARELGLSLPESVIYD